MSKRRSPRITLFLTLALLAVFISANSQPSPALNRAASSAPQEGFTPNGYYRLTNQWQGPGKSLDIVNDGAGNNQLIMADTAEVSGQKWKFTPVGNGYYRLTTQWQGDGKSLDVVNDGEANDQLILAKTADVTGQFWEVVPVGNGYYRLMTEWRGEGWSLDVVNDGENNDQLILAKTADVSGQYWKITKAK